MRARLRRSRRNAARRRLPSQPTSPSLRTASGWWRRPSTASARSTSSSTTPPLSPFWPLIDAEAAEAARFFAVNAIGPLNGARAFAKWAIEHGRSGAIVNVSSIAAGRPVPGLGLYSASKAALESLTRSMAVEWAGKGLRVNAVAPGHVKTEGVLEDFRAGRLDEAAMLARIPDGRIDDGDDIADAVLFLCSEQGAPHHRPRADGGAEGRGSDTPVVRPSASA